MKISRILLLLCSLLSITSDIYAGNIEEAALARALDSRHKNPHQAIRILEEHHSAFDQADPAIILASQFELFNLYGKIGFIQKSQKTLDYVTTRLASAEEFKPWLVIMQSHLDLSKHLHNAALASLQTITHQVKTSKDPQLMMWFDYLKGSAYVQENHYDKALDVLNQALAAAIKHQNTIVQLGIYDQLLVIFYYMQDYDRALDQTDRLMEMAKELQDSFSEARALASRMKIFYTKSVVQQGLIANAKSDEARQVEIRKSDNFKKIAREAEEKTLELSRKIGDYRTLVNALIMQQTRAILVDDTEAVLKIARETLNIAEEHNFLYETAVTYNNIAIAYRGTKDHNKGIAALKKAEKIYQELNIEQSMAWVLEDYALAYQMNDEFEKALDYYGQYHEAILALMAKTNNQKVLELQEQFESDKKQREYESLSQENALIASKLKTQKTQSIMFIGFLLSLVIIAVLQYNRYKVISHKNRKLEMKEALVREKTRDLHSILDNIYQGVVTIGFGDGETLSIKEVSRHVYTILQSDPDIDIAHSDPISLLFGKSSLNQETLSIITSTLICSINEFDYQWDFNRQNLPSEMTLFKENKTVELDWSVILLEKKVTKILVTMKDVTDLRKLARQQIESENNIQKLISLSLMEQRDYFLFINSVKNLLVESKQIISEHSEYQRDVIDASFRNLHTIKGLARSYDMRQLSNFIHEIEESFHRIRDQSLEYNQQSCLDLLLAIDIEIETYIELARSKLKWDMGHASVNLAVSDLTRWYNNIAEVHQETGMENRKIEILLKEIKKKYSSTFADTFQEITMSMQKLGRELNKGIINFTVKGEDIFVNQDYIDPIKAIFIHLIRNSVDHGIQTTEERERLGLPHPEITVELQRYSDHYEIIQTDNGKGLDLESLASKAMEQNLPVDCNDPMGIANLIFRNGISTKKEVTDISGRGVGMDAVKSYLEKYRGSIRIIAKGEPQNNSMAFAFAIELPGYFFET